MKWFADENIDWPIIQHLRSEGFDLDSIVPAHKGADDDRVIELANSVDAVLLTSDKDFGELVYRLKRVTRGVVLFRLDGMPIAERGKRISQVLRAHEIDLKNAFTVVTETGIRIRTL